jgi:hypothetical protein
MKLPNKQSHTESQQPNLLYLRFLCPMVLPGLAFFASPVYGLSLLLSCPFISDCMILARVRLYASLLYCSTVRALSVCLPVCLSAHYSSICLSFFLYVCHSAGVLSFSPFPFVCHFACLQFCLFRVQSTSLLVCSPDLQWCVCLAVSLIVCPLDLNLSVYLTVCLSAIPISTCPSVSPVCLSALLISPGPSVCLFASLLSWSPLVCLSACLLVCSSDPPGLSVCHSACLLPDLPLSVCLPVCFSALLISPCLSVCPSACLRMEPCVCFHLL